MSKTKTLRIYYRSTEDGTRYFKERVILDFYYNKSLNETVSVDWSYPKDLPMSQIEEFILEQAERIKKQKNDTQEKPTTIHST